MAAHRVPLSLGFSRQEHWSGLPFPSPMHACMLSRFSHVWLCATPWTAAHLAPLSMEFSRQEYWSGLPFLSSRIPSKYHYFGTWADDRKSQRVLSPAKSPDTTEYISAQMRGFPILKVCSNLWHLKKNSAKQLFLWPFPNWGSVEEIRLHRFALKSVSCEQRPRSESLQKTWSLSFCVSAAKAKVFYKPCKHPFEGEPSLCRRWKKISCPLPRYLHYQW